jgi:hypothetical protein
MVILSLALHGVLAGSIALLHWRGPATLASTNSSPVPSEVILLRSQQIAGVPLAAPAPPRPIAAIPLAAPLPPAPTPAPTISATPAALALEANPNAHVRALPPEAVLSPTPPPRLNGRDGVVFILDVSGSMYEPYAGSTRLALARQELARRIEALKDGTPFAITLYAQNARNSGPLVAAGNATRDAAVRFIMRDVDCGGGTNLPAALASAAGLHTGSLVLASDGDLNIAAYKLQTAVQAILGTGHGLTVIGIGPRPNTTAEPLLQGLADQQGGVYIAQQFERNSRLLTSATDSTAAASATP